MSQSIPAPRKDKQARPEKPFDGFPLFPHATRRWAKKIRGKMHYFGPWDDPYGALQKYQEQKDDLHAGRTPRVQGEGLAVRDLVNRFLTSKRHLLDTREITPRTFQDYYATCERIVAAFGRSRLVGDLASEDFERLQAGLAERWGPVALGNEIQRVRVAFKFGYDAGLIDKPMRYGPGFKRPSKKVLRLSRAAKGARMFEAEEIRSMLATAGQPLKAMLLLGVNCGFGNTDVSSLPLTALDLDGGWVNFPRPKTGIPRRCVLWAETATALREAIAVRPTAKDPTHAGLVFLTRCGATWVKSKLEADPAETDEGSRVKVTVKADDALAKETAKLLKRLNLCRKGTGFYALRHVFETIGGEAKDQVAVDSVMGHAPNDMASVYRERVSDERLKAVAEFVRGWLFLPAQKAKRGKKKAASQNGKPLDTAVQ